MEMFSGSDRVISETYMIPGTGLNPQLASTPPLDEIDYMGNEAAPDFMLDQGQYYPAAANYYGYYCTGFESPGELDDHHRFFGSDGQEFQSGLQTDGTPYVYYTPSYEYPQSPYNPYNPYIPGAVIGFDSPYVGTQQYLTGSVYQQPISSSAYVPIVVHPSSDVPQSFSDQLTASNGTSVPNRPDTANIKYSHLLASSSTAANTHKLSSGYPISFPSQASSQQPQNLSKISEGFLSATTHSKQPSGLGVVGPARIHQVSQFQPQCRSSDVIQAAHHISNRRDSSVENPSKRTFLTSNGFTNFSSNSHGWDMSDKLGPGVQLNGSINNRNGTNILADQHRAPRAIRSKGQWTSAITVRAYGPKAAASDAQGNIVIQADQYNREDFPLDYPDAKFFVIKSYSEDDVHKSIKYNVWSSTPNGNKKLDAAYEEAQRISVGKPKGCPVFLFFSVNASGHFCGVAEMVSPVDFSKDMDFWQQDKWIGSFPVKWHMIKDVPNTNFRHIILENNENRPVTSSRDTQEVPYLPGLSMLHIFKSSPLRTSVLDDFVFYEERQKVTEEERSRLPRRGYNAAFALSSSVPSERPSGTVYLAPMANGKQQNGLVAEFPRADGKQLHVTVEPLPKRDSERQTGGVIPHVEVGKKSDISTTAAAVPILANEVGKAQAISVNNNIIRLQAGVKQGKKETNCLADQLPEIDRNSARVDHPKETVSAKDCLMDPSSSKDNPKPEPVVDASDMESVIQIGSLSIEPKQGEANCLGSGERDSSSVDVVTVGSMHIRVNKNGQSSLVDKAEVKDRRCT